MVISKTAPPFLEAETVVQTVCSIPNLVNIGQSLKGACPICELQGALASDEDACLDDGIGADSAPLLFLFLEESRPRLRYRRLAGLLIRDPSLKVESKSKVIPLELSGLEACGYTTLLSLNNLILYELNIKGNASHQFI
ncbi:hypothetical protein NPIL_344351 [Nephila pilipes]|uniref:Uncharacterized protein n=1 Tax=Nephila pilipes TaxID=299642 RepID=A0A8X6TCE6_NEPPI|nr:hypothetical protein NPIL_344351 [Nephila pilipes]